MTVVLVKMRHNVNLQNLMCNNLNVDLFKVNAFAKFGLIPSIHSLDTERKLNSDNLDLVKVNAYAKFDQAETKFCQ